MQNKIESIPGGSVTSPEGFQAGAVYSGIKKKAGGALDLGILFSEAPCATAGVLTTNRIKAAPVVLSGKRLKKGNASAIVINSGCANACTGEEGMADALEMTALAAKKVGLSPEAVLVASTGVIGQKLPIERIRAGMDKIKLSRDGGHTLARAIMTTDTVPKEIAVRSGEGRFVLGGIAKGAGMIHPSLATMLCFLTTDAAVEINFLRQSLKLAADISFNMLSVDGDTSTNDTVLLMANGRAGNEPIKEGGRLAADFQEALNRVCIYLAKEVARDGEGATKLIEVNVSGAPSAADARQAARTVVSSPLLKAAIHGNDPNWGRVLAAVGRSGVPVVEAKTDLFIGGLPLLRSGRPVPFEREKAIEALDKKEVTIAVNLNLGKAEATAWGCDLSEEYVTINSEYTT